MEISSKIIEKKKNLNYLKPNKRHMLKESKDKCKLLHKRIIELEFELEKEINEKNVGEMVKLLKVIFFL
jgi:hypothetical protein